MLALLQSYLPLLNFVSSLCYGIGYPINIYADSLKLTAVDIGASLTSRNSSEIICESLKWSAKYFQMTLLLFHFQLKLSQSSSGHVHSSYCCELQLVFMCSAASEGRICVPATVKIGLELDILTTDQWILVHSLLGCCEHVIVITSERCGKTFFDIFCVWLKCCFLDVNVLTGNSAPINYITAYSLRCWGKRKYYSESYINHQFSTKGQGYKDAKVNK